MVRHGSDSRSRSPYRHEQSSKRQRRRSRSPRHRGRHSETHRHDDHKVPRVLPFNAQPLSRAVLRSHRSMFALYLDIQKQLDIDELGQDEVRGRWKSFVGKWNRGELAEGWYDPKTLEKAQASEKQSPSLKTLGTEKRGRQEDASDEDDDESDNFGPSPPTDLVTVSSQHRSTSTHRAGPAIPSIHDLRAQREVSVEAAAHSRSSAQTDLQISRRDERKILSSGLDDLTSRPAVGTRERALEKKREANFSNKSFAAAAHDSTMPELPDSAVMGDEDSLSDLKRMKAETERKKNDREIRREENLRARMAEREERMRGMREKEEQTMSMLREIAQARYGGGGGGEHTGS